jgi:hypothetical protein
MTTYGLSLGTVLHALSKRPSRRSLNTRCNFQSFIEACDVRECADFLTDYSMNLRKTEL